MRMKFPRGSAVLLGILAGAVIGFLTDNLLSFVFLGAMFGLIGEAYERKEE